MIYGYTTTLLSVSIMMHVKLCKLVYGLKSGHTVMSFEGMILEVVAPALYLHPLTALVRYFVSVTMVSSLSHPLMLMRPSSARSNVMQGHKYRVVRNTRTDRVQCSAVSESLGMHVTRLLDVLGTERI